MNTIRSQLHEVYTEEIKWLSMLMMTKESYKLMAFRLLHTDITRHIKMIDVEGLLLPNKPLSNVDLNDAAKKL